MYMYIYIYTYIYIYIYIYTFRGRRGAREGCLLRRRTNLITDVSFPYSVDRRLVANAFSTVAEQQNVKQS